MIIFGYFHPIYAMDEEGQRIIDNFDKAVKIVGTGIAVGTAIGTLAKRPVFGAGIGITLAMGGSLYRQVLEINQMHHSRVRASSL